MRLTALPPVIRPGGSGVIVVQLVNGSGVPTPTPTGTAIDLYSSDPLAVSMPSQVTVPPGKSHAEANYTALSAGNVTVTAVADGLNAATVQVSPSAASSYALRIAMAPLQQVAAPGDTVPVLVELMAGGIPFDAPFPVEVTVASSAPGSSLTQVQISPGSSFGYAGIQVPSGSNQSFIRLTASADGFMSNSTARGVAPKGSGAASAALLGPLAVLPSGATAEFSISLVSNAGQPADGPATFQLFSSNESVVSPLVSSLTVTAGEDIATFEAQLGTNGTAQLTALAPGIFSQSLNVSVAQPYAVKMHVDAPSVVRVGETYSFSVELVGQKGILSYDGALAVPTYSNDTEIQVQSEVSTASGYGIGTFTVAGPGSANITAVVGGYFAGFAGVRAYSTPLVVPVTYQVSAATDSGPLSGLPINFTYRSAVTTVLTGPSGVAAFEAHNDTITLATAPSSFTIDNRTFFFTGWSNGVRGENVSLLSSAPTYSITAQYFTTTYTFLALSDGQEPVAGLRFNVSSAALKENFTLTTDNKGTAQFALPKGSSFTVSVPVLYQPSGQTKYSFLNLENSTRNVVNITAPAAMIIDAKYATYYQFQVTSPIGNTTGSGWYRSGSSAPYSLSETSSGGPLVFQRFAGWTGSFSSDQPSGSTVITSPEFITAQWSTDNTLLFAAIGGVIAAAAVIGLLIFRLKKRIAPS